MAQKPMLWAEVYARALRASPIVIRLMFSKHSELKYAAPRTNTARDITFRVEFYASESARLTKYQ